MIWITSCHIKLGLIAGKIQFIFSIIICDCSGHFLAIICCLYSYIGKGLVLRGSYNYKRRQEMQIPDKLGMIGFAWGIGLKISKFQINYARSTFHVVGSPNFISISTDFDSFRR